MPFTLAELAADAGVSPRTIRFYVAQGLLRGPEGAGPGARYNESDLHRLRLIRRLQAQHLPLAEIRRRLDTLTDTDVATLVSPGVGETAPGSALDYIRGLLEPSRPPPMPVRASEPPSSMQQVASAPAITPAPSPEPESPTRSQWERISLGPDVELHIRRPLTRPQNKRVERLIAIARELLEEEGS